MTTREEHSEFAEWSHEWRSIDAPMASSTVEIRDYVRKRGSVVKSFLFADLAIGAIMLPVLLFIALTTDNPVERLSMLALATITSGAVGFGWWNWRGVISSSTANVSEFIDLSIERLRRMRMAWRFAWLVLAGEVSVFTIWIRDQLYSVPAAPAEGAERFAWAWLFGFSLAAAAGLMSFGRWLKRDAARFETLRQDFSAASGNLAEPTQAGLAKLRSARKARRPPLT